MKTFRVLFAALAAQLILVGGANGAELTAAQKREIIFDCTQLVYDYGYYRDLRDPAGFSGIFTEDARFQGGGKWYSGRMEISHHVLEDDMSSVSMHLMTTVKIIPLDKDNATGVTYAAVAHEPGVKGAPADLQNFQVLGEYHDKFRRTADGWKISERTFAVIFKKPAGAGK